MPSTAIRDFFHDPAKRQLWVTFVTGRRYIYDEISSEIFDAFKTAPSRGTFFTRHIRDRYPYREVTRGAPWRTADLAACAKIKSS